MLDLKLNQKEPELLSRFRDNEISAEETAIMLQLPVIVVHLLVRTLKAEIRNRNISSFTRLIKNNTSLIEFSM